MKFTCSVVVQKPIDRTVALWNDPDNLKEWQDGFLGIEHLSGEPEAVGSKYKFRYKMGRGEFDLIETVMINDLPGQFKALYEHKNMSNTMDSRFTALDENTTRWDAEIEYTIMRGFMIKLMSWIMPGMFKKQTQKWFDQFKEFAERQEG